MTAQFISDTHDYVVIYCRSAEAASLGRFERSDEAKSKFTNPDDDPRGPWKAENLSAGKYYSAGQFQIVGPTGLTFSPPPGRYWRCNETQYNLWPIEPAGLPGAFACGQGRGSCSPAH